MSDETYPPAAVAAVQAKLRALHDALPDDEQTVLEALLTHASVDGGDERAERMGAENSIIIVGGRLGSQIRLGLDPGGSVSLNPQPIPPGRVSQAR